MEKEVKEDRDPWRLHTAEHLWSRLIEVTEKKEIAENRLYLYAQLIQLFVDRDIMMEKVARAETDSIKQIMLDNIGMINDQIENLMINLGEWDNE